jgi:hypothetical protein
LYRTRSQLESLPLSYVPFSCRYKFIHDISVSWTFP